MNVSCEIVADLLPGYLDNSCSGESRALVEAHLTECLACSRLLEELRGEMAAGPVTPALDGADVLKRTSWVVSRRAVGAAAGITAIVVWWLVYFWQDYLADWGDYRFFSYRFHELWSAGLMAVPLAAVVWLAVLVYRSRKGKAWRKNGVLLLALALIVVLQTGWFVSQRDLWSTSTCGVVEIVDDTHIRLHNRGENVVLLEVSPTVMGLLVEEEKVYSVTYSHKSGQWDSGRLEYIYVTDLPADLFS